MIDFLLGVPGALKTLTDRLSATWAAKVDTLHDTRLTSARAGFLDKLNITGNVASASGGMIGSLKSIQRGFISCTGASATAAITAVTVGKSSVALLGMHGIAGAPSGALLPLNGFVEIFDATTVKFTIQRTYGSDTYSGTITVAFEVKEYY